MKNSKWSISKRIFLSHMLTISICIILTLVVFIISFKIFIRQETRRQIISASKILTQTISENLNKDNKKTVNDNQILQNSLKVENALKQVQNYTTINYGLIDKNENVISLNENRNQDKFIRNKLVPSINTNRIYNSKINNSNVFILNISSNKYEVIVAPLKLKGELDRYLIIYSDLSKSNDLSNIVFFMLFLILLVSAAIGLVISNRVAKRICEPIYKLIRYAKKLGERKYDVKLEQYEEDEIGELADTMSSMANKLSIYDDTIKTFFQNASHEIRTPLMSIQGYAEAIKYGVAKEGTAVDIIIEESKRLSVLVEDLLFLSKIDAMQENFKIEDISISDVVISSIEKINGIAVKEGKTINFTNKNNENILLLGDKEKLIRAIINILGNCLRYCKKDVDVVLYKTESKAFIEISDDGPGIEEAAMVHIFDRFYKGQNGNHGLGLSITKSIVERLEGTIIVKNKEMGGAIFIIEFTCI